MVTGTSHSFDGHDPDDGEIVELIFPPRARHLRLARLLASGFAVDMGFTIDEIEDLRLAVDEACAVLVAHAAPGARLRLSIRSIDEVVCIEGRCIVGSDDDVDLGIVARSVLDATVDKFELYESGENLAFALHKRGTLGSS